MNIVFVTIDDLHFLTKLFDKLIPKINSTDVVRTIIVRPLYKGQTTFTMASRYLKTFGVKEFLYFSFDTIFKQLLSILWRKKQSGVPLKVSQIFSKYSKECIHFDGDVNSKECLDLLRKWDVDLLISVGCPQLFKKELVHLPESGCLNLHGALLPNYRGVLPSFWMLKNSEEYAGNTLFFVNDDIDGGDILIQEHFPIEKNDTMYSLIARSKQKASNVILQGISKVKEGSYDTVPMELNQGSYYSWPQSQDVREFWAAGKKIR
jgi:methionyl-tRNA formyltransferase